MKHVIALGKRTLPYVCLLQVSIIATFAQSPSTTRCQVTSTPVQARAEGLTERMGDILLQCTSSQPGITFNGNFSIFLPVSVTNRVDATNLTRDAVLSVDLGSGMTPDRNCRAGIRQQHRFQRCFLHHSA